MNKCKRCNVWVADDTMVCPLCHTILTEEKLKGQKSGSGFPDSEFEYNGARYVDIDSVADKRFLIQGPCIVKIHGRCCSVQSGLSYPASHETTTRAGRTD